MIEGVETLVRSGKATKAECLLLARCRCQGRRAQRPQLDQVPPSTASAVESGCRCNRRPHTATASGESCRHSGHRSVSLTDPTATSTVHRSIAGRGSFLPHHDVCCPDQLFASKCAVGATASYPAKPSAATATQASRIVPLLRPWHMASPFSLMCCPARDQFGVMILVSTGTSLAVRPE